VKISHDVMCVGLDDVDIGYSICCNALDNKCRACKYIDMFMTNEVNVTAT